MIFLHFFGLWLLIVDICTPVHSLAGSGIAGQGARKQLEAFPPVIVSLIASVVAPGSLRQASCE
jgi:hypothetical protein